MSITKGTLFNRGTRYAPRWVWTYRCDGEARWETMDPAVVRSKREAEIMRQTRMRLYLEDRKAFIGGVRVDDVCNAYWGHVDTYYRKKRDSPFLAQLSTLFWAQAPLNA